MNRRITKKNNKKRSKSLKKHNPKKVRSQNGGNVLFDRMNEIKSKYVRWLESKSVPDTFGVIDEPDIRNDLVRSIEIQPIENLELELTNKVNSIFEISRDEKNLSKLYDFIKSKKFIRLEINSLKEYIYKKMEEWLSNNYDDLSKDDNILDKLESVISKETIIEGINKLVSILTPMLNNTILQIENLIEYENKIIKHNKLDEIISKRHETLKNFINKIQNMITELKNILSEENILKNFYF